MGEVAAEKKWGITSRAFIEEQWKTISIAAPMVAVSVLQYMLQVVSVIMVGHLGQLSLSSVAIATSLTNVFGFSLLSGLVGGLETLCGQAFGAQQYQKIGLYTQSAIISLNFVSLLISITWIFMDKFLILIGQDPQISREARKYSVWLIPALFGCSILKPIVRFLQTQSITFPMLLSSFLVLCFHVPLCWILVYKLEMGIVGAALAFGLSTWLNVLLLGFYVVFSSACEKTQPRLSTLAFLGIGEFFKLAVPSAVMVCLKWWSCELLVLFSGLLPNPKLETSTLSICLTISTLHFTVAYGFGAAVSTRVSNELGAGNSSAARVAVWATMSLATTEAVVVATTLFCGRYILGYAYSSDKDVVHYIAAMTPFLCLSIVMDSLQAVLSGVARGSGWQHIGAYINLGAFYLVGLPLGLVLGFAVHLRAKGFWLGIVSGTAVQSALLLLVAVTTDWRKQANCAKKRVAIDDSHEEQDSLESNSYMSTPTIISPKLMRIPSIRDEPRFKLLPWTVSTSCLYGKPRPIAYQSKNLGMMMTPQSRMDDLIDKSVYEHNREI